MFAALGRAVFRHRVAIVVVYALLIPLGVFSSKGVLPLLRSGGFEDPTAESWQVRDILNEELKLGNADLVLLVQTEAGTIEDVEVVSAIIPLVEEIKRDPMVVSAASFFDAGIPAFVSVDKKTTLVLVSIGGDDETKSQVFSRLRPVIDKAVATVPGLRVQYAGIAPVNSALYATIERDLWRAELIAFPLTALLLVVIFQSLASAALPLILGACSVACALAAMRLLVVVTDVSLFSANVISILGLGLAIDYSLFLVARFREELAAGRSVEDALVVTCSTTGRAVAFSGLTVLASACGLFVFPQMFLRSVAFGALAVVAGSMIMALTLLPALLALLGPRVDSLRVPLLPRPTSDVGAFWLWISRVVMKRPFLVAIGVVVPMVVMALPFERFNPSLPDHRILPKGTPARTAMETLNTAFLPHQLAAHDVIVTFRDGDVFAPALVADHLAVLASVHDQIRAIPGVARVDGPLSVQDIVGRERALAMLALPRDQQDPNLLLVLDSISEGPRVRIGVVSSAEFNDELSLRQVQALRALQVPAHVEVRVGGVSGVLFDLQAAIRTRGPIMVGFTCAVMFFVLFLVFGSVTLPLKAMIMNFLSLTASFGALVWVFQDGRFTDVLDYEPLYLSDATEPLILFAVVFGLSMDYEVLLLSRVREEFEKTGDNEASVAMGLARTGRLITNAAALLVVVVGAFITSDILFMKTLGIGMALAVGLDATVIRALLVPATMRMMGQWNWWAPAPLRRLWLRAGLGDGHG
jgi:trehalose monomycolate/heme transporter